MFFESSLRLPIATFNGRKGDFDYQSKQKSVKLGNIVLSVREFGPLETYFLVGETEDDFIFLPSESQEPIFEASKRLVRSDHNHVRFYLLDEADAFEYQKYLGIERKLKFLQESIKSGAPSQERKIQSIRDTLSSIDKIQSLKLEDWKTEPHKN